MQTLQILVKICHLIWPLFELENLLISSSTQFLYLKTTPQSDLIQNKLIPASLGTDWIENERFRLVLMKTIIFMPKTGARNYRPRFRENKPKTLVFYDWKRAFWACFREYWVYKFGHGSINSGTVSYERNSVLLYVLFSCAVEEMIHGLVPDMKKVCNCASRGWELEMLFYNKKKNLCEETFYGRRERKSSSLWCFGTYHLCKVMSCRKG